MGLHLNFELRLAASTSPDSAAATLIALRTHALTLEFAEVSPFLSEFATDGGVERERLESLRFWASIIAQPYELDVPPLRGDAATAQGFFVNPGKGCETAFFGLLRRSEAAGTNAEWYWRCSCKTQYASIVSDAHLIVCHTSLVRLLDLAIQLGIDVVVHDETHYWETRDESRLVSEVQAMNRIVAGFAGLLSDAIGSEHGVQASIFSHPRFEHLEMGEGE